jgi:hypothetical protein
MADEQASGSVGPATDRFNAPVIDPTENVKALNSAEAKRQDGLREAESRHLREILRIRSKHAQQLDGLRAELQEEKFNGVKREQALTESHRLELKGDSEKALTAALSAADKAVDKAVSGLKELIVNNGDSAKAGIGAITDKVEDLKTTVGMLVNTRIGAQETKTEQRGVTAATLAVVGVVVSLVAIIAPIVVVLALR